MAQNIFTFFLSNSILYLNTSPGTVSFTEIRSIIILVMNFIILIVFFENTLFINITSFLMFFLTSTVITFNIKSDSVANEDERLMSVIGVYKIYFGFFIMLTILLTFVTIAFVRMNRELMGAIEFNMVQKAHFE